MVFVEKFIRWETGLSGKKKQLLRPAGCVLRGVTVCRDKLNSFAGKGSLCQSPFNGRTRRLQEDNGLT